MKKIMKLLFSGKQTAFAVCLSLFSFSGIQKANAAATSTIASANPAVPAANIVQSSVKQSIYSFTIAVSGTTPAPNLTGFTFTTAGTYLLTDVTKFQLWSNTINDLASASQISTDITATLGAGAHPFAAFSQPMAIGSTYYFWVTTDVAAAAVLARTITVSAITTASITVSAGSKAGSAFAGGAQTIIAPFTSTISSANPAVPVANILQGSVKQPVYSFNIDVAGTGTNPNLTGFNFTTAGTYLAADVTKFQLWYNTINDLASASQISTNITTTLGPATHTFAAFSQTMAIGGTYYFWVTTDVALAALITKTLTTNAITTANITVSGGNKAGTAFAGGTQTITSTFTSTIASSNPAVPVANLSQGSVKQPIYSFNIDVAGTGTNPNLTGFTFTTNAGYVIADVTKFQLWYNTINDLASASQISTNITTTLGPGAHPFAAFSQAMPIGATYYFWVTTDVAAIAIPNNTITVAAITTASTTISTGGKVGTPFIGGTQTITGALSTLASPSPSLPVANISQGSVKQPIYFFNMAVSGSGANPDLTGFNFSSYGTCTATDISKFQLWYNTINDLASASQISTDITAALGAGAHTFAAFSQSLPIGSTCYFWVTTDVNSNATPARYVGVSAITTANITFSYGGKTGSASMSLSQTVIGALSTLASPNPAVPASNMFPGSVKQPVYNFTLTVAGNSSNPNLTGVTFTTNAGYLAADVTKFQLWYNTTNNLSTATQISTDIVTTLGPGTHSFAAFSQAIAIGGPYYFWITTDVDASPTLANTVTVAAMTTADLTVSYGAKLGAAFIGGTQTIAATISTIASANPAIPAAFINAGSVKQQVYSFNITVSGSGAAPNLTGFTFTTNSGYLATDISKFQLWYSTVNNLATATQISTDIVTTLGPGAHSFAAFSQAMPVGGPYYFWVTTDVATALGGNYITVAAITTANITVSSGGVAGTAYAGGAQTILAIPAVNGTAAPFEKTYPYMVGNGWTQNSNCLETPDNYLVLFGSSTIFGWSDYIIKLSNNGSLVWARGYTNPNIINTWQNYGIQLSSGDYIVCGNPGTASPDELAMLMKVNSTGDVLWAKRYGGILQSVGPWKRDGIGEVVETAGGLVFGGYTTQYSWDNTYHDYTLIKTDLNGNVIWSFTGYINGFNSYDGINYLRESNTGGFYMAGYLSAIVQWVGKTDANGNVLWSNTYSNHNLLYGIEATSDGGCMILGSSSTIAAGNYATLMKLSSTGSVEWANGYKGDEGNDVVQTTDGSYVVCGSVTAAGGLGNSDGWVFKTDPNGALLWSKLYGGSKNDYFNSVTETADGGYFLGGRSDTWSPGSNGAGAWSMKINPDGTNPAACNTTTYAPAVVDYAATISVAPSGLIQVSTAITPTVETYTANTVAPQESCCSGTCTQVLPVALVSFTGKNSGETNVMEWLTVSETRSDYFVVERSRDGKTFEPVGKVKGAGNSTVEKTYSFTDEHPFSGINYYRLKQVDYDGNFSYSQTVSVTTMHESAIIKIYPVPSGKELSCEFYSDENSEIKIYVTDVLGNTMLRKDLKAKQGLNKDKIDIEKLPHGIYYLEMNDRTRQSQLKFVKE